jgi:hypothetical protein
VTVRHWSAGTPRSAAFSERIAVIERKTGAVVSALGEQGGGIGMKERFGTHTRFFGPRSPRAMGTYVNDWEIIGTAQYRERWLSARVKDPETTTELYYDKSTGILVGRRLAGVGYAITEWLVRAPEIPSMVNLPGPNQTFLDEEPAQPTEEEVPFEGR